MPKATKKFCLLLLGLLLSLNASQQAAIALSLEEQSVLAALALNVVRFTAWPAEALIKDTLNFCVVGDNVVQQSFVSLDHKAVGDKVLTVIKLSRLRNFESCHILYISGEIKQNILAQVLLEIKKHPLLTIGEGYDFAGQGGMVGLENIDGKITLNVNLPVVRESNLTISSRLLKLANIIGN